MNSKSETNSTLLTNQKYEKLIKENEELKIKNKNQEEEIMRLKVENSNYKEKQEKAEQ